MQALVVGKGLAQDRQPLLSVSFPQHYASHQLPETLFSSGVGVWGYLVCAGILGTEGSQLQDNVFTVRVLSKKWNPRARGLVSAILSLGHGAHPVGQRLP